jgi:hypothetical protein
MLGAAVVGTANSHVGLDLSGSGQARFDDDFLNRVARGYNPPARGDRRLRQCAHHRDKGSGDRRG